MDEIRDQMFCKRTTGIVNRNGLASIYQRCKYEENSRLKFLKTIVQRSFKLSNSFYGKLEILLERIILSFKITTYLDF